MKRDSFLYKARRKMQVIAHHIFSDETMSKFYYKVVLRKKLNIVDPRTLNEKLQWLKLYYFPNNPLVVQCTDKYAVRDYVTQKGYGNNLVPLLGSWYDSNAINWDELPVKFMLKCNHGCAYNILCSDKDRIDKGLAMRQLDTWLKEDFGAFNIEPHYSKIKPHRIICEEYLGDCITDYKFFCFNGIPKYILVSKDSIHDRQSQVGFFNLDGTKIPLRRDDYADIPEVSFPPFYKEMEVAASELSKDFPFVRVDFFLANGTFYFAELTFTPGGCMMSFNPEKYDMEYGKMLEIKELIEDYESK